MSTSEDQYVLGHTESERQRLGVQAEILNPITERFLRMAGISEGMRVLDLGCGTGEVSLIAARLVGSTGAVHGVDLDADALDAAKQRAELERICNFTAERTDILQSNSQQVYDAVIGRHILIHSKDPLSVLRKSAQLISDGGIVAFQEYDLSWFARGYPALPFTFGVLEMIVEFFSRAVPMPNIGTRLFNLMLEAGLCSPRCSAEIVADGGPKSLVYEWFAQTIKSIAPKMQAVGMKPLDDQTMLSLGDRMRVEATTNQAIVMGPLIVGVAATKTNQGAIVD